ncbi:MAG: peptidase M28 [Crocinitomicaceae bacterium]|nr:peptidase M28 [Crocinitomicaceae bacterium]
MRNLFIFPFLFFTACSLLKPNEIIESNQEQALKYSKQISKQDLFKDLSVLASDSLEGRETATKGQKKAAEYIKNHFIKNNIKSVFDTSYYQQFEVNVFDFTNVSLKINNNDLKLVDDFFVIGSPKKTQQKNISVVDVNYGIENNKINDYLNKDVSGKVVMMMDGLPKNIQDYNIIDGNWRNKLKIAEEKGAIAILLVVNNYEKENNRIKEHILYPRMKMHNSKKVYKNETPVFYISKKVKSLILNNNKIISFHTSVNNITKAENVLGYIPGKKINEALVISAHYDHIGYDQGEVCNGADDDGSGTAALLSISKAFQKAYEDGYQPERSILFLAVSGEEKGLWGSKFYTDNPYFELEKTIADLNIDMVGRRDTIQKNDDYIYLIGSDKISKDLHQINESINSKHIGFKLDYRYNKDSDPNKFYYRSDHYNFAKNNIPVIFYFGGLHEDYHMPTDEIDKINFNKLEKVAQYVFLTAWELANRETKLK